MQKQEIPGLSLAVFADGKIVWAKGFGVTEAGGSTPVTTQTLFQAGSVSKPVSAAAALKLSEAGAFSLDADVNDRLKSWKVPENDFTRTEKVSVRRLLTHTAGMTIHGFPGYAVHTPLPTLLQVLHGGKPANTLAIQVNAIPGSAWRYSGGGYTVLQQLMIDVSGQPFPEVMRDTVLRPLGMVSSTFVQPLPDSLAKQTATGHYAGAKPVAGRWHVYPEMAAAGLWTTASDLARFALGIQASLTGASGALLKPETARLMVTPGLGGYGLGFSISGDGASARFSHGGRDAGFDTMLMAYRERSQGMVVMINANDDSDFMRKIVAAVGQAYNWR